MNYACIIIKGKQKLDWSFFVNLRWNDDVDDDDGDGYAMLVRFRLLTFLFLSLSLTFSHTLSSFSLFLSFTLVYDAMAPLRYADDHDEDRVMMLIVSFSFFLSLTLSFPYRISELKRVYWKIILAWKHAMSQSRSQALPELNPIIENSCLTQRTKIRQAIHTFPFIIIMIIVIIRRKVILKSKK